MLKKQGYTTALCLEHCGAYSRMPNNLPLWSIVNFWIFFQAPNAYLEPTLLICYSKYFFTHLYRNWRSQHKHSSNKISVIKYEKNMWTICEKRSIYTGSIVKRSIYSAIQHVAFVSTTTFKSNQTNKTFKIYHRVNCKSSFVIYQLECYICNIQYVGKSETPFNIRLNNHRKDVKNPNAIPACKHFNRHDHDFNNHGKIIIIEQLRNIRTTSTEKLKERLKQRENFWLMKLETLEPLGLNQDQFELVLSIVKTKIILLWRW